MLIRTLFAATLCLAATADVAANDRQEPPQQRAYARGVRQGRTREAAAGTSGVAGIETRVVKGAPSPPVCTRSC